MRSVCFGDSFVRGFGVKADENWVFLLNTPCSTFINHGICGDTTGGMLARFGCDVVPEKPNYLFLLGGLNDLLAGSPETTVQANYFAMVHQALHHGMIPVICTCPPFDPNAARRCWPELTSLNLSKGVTKHSGTGFFPSAGATSWPMWIFTENSQKSFPGIRKRTGILMESTLQLKAIRLCVILR